MEGTVNVELEGISSSITLDSELQEAYSGTTGMNSAMSGDFPVLLPGANAISWAGGVSKAKIRPDWKVL